MAILYQKTEEWHIAYMKRTSRFPTDKHAGQISFPGGSQEANESIIQCAFRETYEEFGITADKLVVLGALKELHVYVSNFLVYPFVAFANEPLQFNPEEAEVDEILEIPLAHILDPTTKKTKDISVRDRVLKNMPYYDLYGNVMWGATAIITDNLVNIITEINKSRKLH